MQAHTPALPTLADHEAAARTVLDEATWAYINGGAGDEHTLHANAHAWQALRLRPRVLQPLAGGHTQLELLGRRCAHPLLAAPMAYQMAVHPHGEQGLALACAALGAGVVLSTQASARLEDVAQLVRPEADRGPLWLQLYLQPDPMQTLALVRRAEDAGYEALVLTVDAPVNGIRDRELRAGWTLPAGMRAVNLPTALAGPPADPAPGPAGHLDELLQHAATWQDVRWLRSHTRLPLLLKGITHPDDARLALDHGADGLIVSNHGGRVLDTMPATAQLLPAIVDVVCGQVPVLIDGGLRRGTDVLKALALGAQAVLLGRPLLHGLAHGGAQGVAQVIRLLKDELQVAMALCGCASLADITPALLAPYDLTDAAHRHGPQSAPCKPA